MAAPREGETAWARALLELSGWRLVGRRPPVPKCVVIFAPHTSNWDFPIMLLVRFAFGHRVYYLAKSSLFRFPFAWFFRLTGGIPVDRSESHSLVSTIAKTFADRDELWLAIAPEGTRSRTDHWKSGFYHIALAAKVPLLFAFLDAKTKECGLSDLFEPTGDATVDLERIRAFYAQKQGIYPERASDIRFLP